ncbi:MAG: glutaredoxin [Nitrosomonadaceae bacterium]|jgi:glutaredoxin|nr:glutaredoxin [Nitrosomonadaceae bacterium]
MDTKVKITVFKWAGSWGPFKITIPCGECSLTRDVIQDTIQNELAGIPIDLDIRDWLSEWWKPLIKGGWHAPIVMVDGAVISQGAALNRGVLTQAVIESYSRSSKIQGNHLFGKDSCPHCKRAKEYLERSGIDYQYHNVISSSRDLYEMLARVKPIIGPKTPIAVPQIWIDGEYVGGANQLSEVVKQEVESNYDSEQCSISQIR